MVLPRRNALRVIEDSIGSFSNEMFVIGHDCFGGFRSKLGVERDANDSSPIINWGLHNLLRNLPSRIGPL